MWRGLQAEQLDEADVAIFGIPIDENCSVGRGASEAPKVLRENSEYLPPVTVSGEVIPKMVFDLGDVSQYVYEQVYEKMDLCKHKKLTLILGGDHSVSILSQKAYRQLHKGRRGIIHIDAHADICDFYNGSHNSHACVNRRAIENGYLNEDITMIGIRSYEVQEVEYLFQNPIDIFSADKVLEMGEEQIISQICNKYAEYEGIYLSFDIDAIDPAYAPGTGTPEAFGLPSRVVLKIIEGIIKCLPVDVMDVVEVAPTLDCNNITSWLALKYILEVFYMIKRK